MKFRSSDIKNVATFYEQDDQLVVETTPKKNGTRIYGIFFLSFWLIGWLMGELFVLNIVIILFYHGAFLNFFTLWITGWTIGGIYAFNMWKYLLWGKEKVIFEKGKITIERVHRIFGREKSYPTGEIRDVQLKLRPNFLLDIFQKNKIKNREADLMFFYKTRRIKFAKKIPAKNAMLLLNKIAVKGILEEDSFEIGY